MHAQTKESACRCMEAEWPVTYGPLEVTQRRADCSIGYVGTCSWDRQTIVPFGFYDGYQNQKRTASRTQSLFV